MKRPTTPAVTFCATLLPCSPPSACNLALFACASSKSRPNPVGGLSAGRARPVAVHVPRTLPSRRQARRRQAYTAKCALSSSRLAGGHYRGCFLDNTTLRSPGGLGGGIGS